MKKWHWILNLSGLTITPIFSHCFNFFRTKYNSNFHNFYTFWYTIRAISLCCPIWSSVARQAMQWNPLDGIGRKQGRPCETWRRTVQKGEQESKQNLALFETTGPVQSSVVSWHCWCPMSWSGSSKLRRRRIRFQ